VDGRDFLEGPEPLTGTIRARLVFDQYLAERTAFLEHRTLLKAALTAIAGSITDDSRLFFSVLPDSKEAHRYCSRVGL